ncbi:MAG: RNA-guided endonuclease TnpB family protein [bacterium]
MIYKAYKYRIYPNVKQQRLLAKTFGCVRYFWNKQVEAFNSYDKETNTKPEFKTSTELRNEIDWMQEVSAAAIQQKEKDFKQFKKQIFSKTRKKQIGRPKYKKKNGKQSFRLPNQKFSIKDSRIRLEKIGWIKMVVDREIDGKLMSVTISKNSSGQYFASILVEKQINKLNKTGYDIGIDVGLKDFLVQSDGIVVANPRYFRESQAKLRRMQQHLSRKKKGSRRRYKCKLKVAKLHQKIVNQRAWFLHNESTRIIKNYDVIAIEDLNVDGLLKNKKLAKSISDVSWSEFFRQLKYKAEWYGKTLVKVDKFAPTSKTCSVCGWKNKNLTLKDRMFACPVCGLEINRDYNAAINIKALGVNSAIRTQSEHKTLSSAIHEEAFSVK